MLKALAIILGVSLFTAGYGAGSQNSKEMIGNINHAITNIVDDKDFTQNKNNYLLQLRYQGQISQEDYERSISIDAGGTDGWPQNWIVSMEPYELIFGQPGCEEQINLASMLIGEWRCPQQPILSIKCMVKIVIDSPMDILDGTYFYSRVCDGEYLVKKSALPGFWEVNYNGRFIVNP